ncbi:hypothetical protein SAMN04244572_02471 [Azotobacter beijerinckii]|uniref:Uncharacterized protein n=1 Tax=Azotobacter beijerinckii TaxID=170623 RepID=A0A1H6VGP8_9GAMM|nr:hypothetical protein SAMN04244572_02471 [Azotobacter beijerinckii]
MRIQHPFARRIVIAFTLMAMLLSGLFSLGIVVIVNSTEKRLATQDLKRELDILLEHDIAQGESPV